MNNENKGLVLGICGVLLFSLTLPVTRFIIEYFDPVFIGLGRAVVAALVAAVLLLFSRSSLPTKKQFLQLAFIASGVVIGFPVLSSWAMKTVDASHGGIMLGLLPLITAFASVFVAQERPSPGFWLAGLIGSLLVIAYALFKGSGSFQAGDIALFGAIVSAAFGYAIGGKLSQEMSGWEVICWALVISFPFLLIPSILTAPQNPLALPIPVWTGFLYLALFSQLFGFFLWNKGLAQGGIARVSQTQLLQPFFTLLFSAILLAEIIDGISILFAFLVVITVAIGKRMPVYHKEITDTH